jgi:hypothetical protein
MPARTVVGYLSRNDGLGLSGRTESNVAPRLAIAVCAALAALTAGCERQTPDSPPATAVVLPASSPTPPLAPASDPSLPPESVVANAPAAPASDTTPSTPVGTTSPGNPAASAVARSASAVAAPSPAASA